MEFNNIISFTLIRMATCYFERRKTIKQYKLLITLKDHEGNINAIIQLKKQGIIII